MREHYPRCPVVNMDCDDPGCPGSAGCVLRDEAKLLRWVGYHPAHDPYLTKRVLTQSFDPVI